MLKVKCEIIYIFAVMKALYPLLPPCGLLGTYTQRLKYYREHKRMWLMQISRPRALGYFFLIIIIIIFYSSLSPRFAPGGKKWNKGVKCKHLIICRQKELHSHLEDKSISHLMDRAHTQIQHMLSLLFLGEVERALDKLFHLILLYFIMTLGAAAGTCLRPLR